MKSFLLLIAFLSFNLIRQSRPCHHDVMRVKFFHMLEWNKDADASLKEIVMNMPKLRMQKIIPTSWTESAFKGNSESSIPKTEIVQDEELNATTMLYEETKSVANSGSTEENTKKSPKFSPAHFAKTKLR